MQCSARIIFPHLALIFSFQAPKSPIERARTLEPPRHAFRSGKSYKTFPRLLYQYLISIDSFLGSIPFQNPCQWTFCITEPLKVYIWNIFKPQRIALKQVMHWFPLTLNYFLPDFPEVFFFFSLKHSLWFIEHKKQTVYLRGWVGGTGTWETLNLFSRSLSLVKKLRHFKNSHKVK